MADGVLKMSLGRLPVLDKVWVFAHFAIFFCTPYLLYINTISIVLSIVVVERIDVN